MGAKYSNQATSGYNATPPADDGSQVASNLITWAGIKNKIGDVLKTFGEAINTALVAAFDYSVRQITSNDTTVAGDHMRCVEIAPTVTTAVTISLGDAATMTNVYRVFIKNSSARNQTLTRITGGDTLDGVAGSVVLAPGEGRVVQTIAAATGYVTVSRSGPFSDGDAIVSGGTDGTKKVRIEVDGLTTATTRVWTAADLDIALGKQPTRQVLTSGTGATYTTPAGATRLVIRMVGGGAGGGGTAANGSDGTASSFNSINANGGIKGLGNGSNAGGAGGVSGTGTASFRVGGTPGGNGTEKTGAGTGNNIGGLGGASVFGGAGQGGNGAVQTGGAATTNSGSGGGGAGGAAGVSSGGGGAGEYLEIVIVGPATTYTYTVGAIGAGAAGGSVGGAGAAGIIIVDEFYN